MSGAAPANGGARGNGDAPVLDLLGVGFGPANLGLAVAVREHAAAVPDQALHARFVERQERFGWHRGMLLDDATMQVSYLKDLVTLRNPTSSFSFLCYLHDRGRLADFVNYGRSYPTRREFHDYLEWAADRVTADGGTAVGGTATAAGDPAAGSVSGVPGPAMSVDYGCDVVEIVPVRSEHGAVESLEVVAEHAGRTQRWRTRNVVLACGLRPALPPAVTAGPRIWHNHDLLARTGALTGTAPSRFVVVGAGQSAAETVEHLHRSFPQAHVHVVFARYGFSPADDSPFANRIFDPGAVDEFYTAPAEVKARLMAYHANTNYSVVDRELIEQLYRQHYHERVAGAERLHLHHVSQVSGISEVGSGVQVRIESLIDGATEEFTADAIVHATGYRPVDPLPLLGGALAAACARTPAGRLDVARDYRVITGPLADGTPVHAGIYLQGPTEHTHGLTSTLLSTVASRAGEIVASILAARDRGAVRVAVEAAHLG